MPTPSSHEQLTAALIETARDFYTFGWHPGGAGSLSARLNEEKFLISRPGAPRGALQPDDFIENSPGEHPLFEAIYQTLSQVEAIFHIHHLEALLCADRDEKRGSTHFRDLAILQHFSKEEELAIDVPALPADTDATELLEKVADLLNVNEEKVLVPALNIPGQGLLVWGHSLQEARRNTELLATLFSFSLRRPMSPKTAAKVSGFQL